MLQPRPAVWLRRSLSTIAAGADTHARVGFEVKKEWPDIGRVHGANAGSGETVVMQEGPEAQGNSGIKGARVRPFNPPVVGSSPTGPTT